MLKMFMSEQIISKQPEKCIFNLPIIRETHSSLGLNSESQIFSL